jgi:hypothetical protein
MKACASVPSCYMCVCRHATCYARRERLMPSECISLVFIHVFSHRDHLSRRDGCEGDNGDGTDAIDVRSCEVYRLIEGILVIVKK